MELERESWGEEAVAELREELRRMADPGYREFQGRLIPGLKHELLGVRIPQLQQLAKRIARGGWREFLRVAGRESYEEILLRGFVIGFAKAGLAEVLEETARFIPEIDNWAVNDCFCSSLKIVRKHREKVWDFLQPYLASDQEYFLRFGLILLHSHYRTPEWIGRVLETAASVRHGGYYVKMGAAWLLSACYVDFPEQTLPLLEGEGLDPETAYRALQKILESNRVSREEKAAVRVLRAQKKEAMG